MNLFKGKIERIYSKIDEQKSKLESMSDKALDKHLVFSADAASEKKVSENQFAGILSIARELAKRSIKDKLFAYREQIIAAIHLHQGAIIEMANGEGKTLVAALAASVNALLSRQQVHISTYNSYLAKRDLLWMGPLYLRMELKPAVLFDGSKMIGFLELVENISEPQDLKMDNTDDELFEIRGRYYKYSAVSMWSRQGKEVLRGTNIVYGTITDFIFQYLRENCADTCDDICFSDELFWLIMDEADYSLIDNALKPHSLASYKKNNNSGWNLNDVIKMYELISEFEKSEDYNLEKDFQITHKGQQKVAKAFGFESIFTPEASGLSLLMKNVARAIFQIERDKNYIVLNGKICLIDEQTGRQMSSRYSWGTHEAILLKENLLDDDELSESNNIAMITIQHFVRLYKQVSGLTATALWYRKEFKEFYDVDTIKIPPHRPCLRYDYPDIIYKTKLERFFGVVDFIIKRNQKRQPILIDCPNILTAELLYDVIRVDNDEQFREAAHRAAREIEKQENKQITTIKQFVCSIFPTLSKLFDELSAELVKTNMQPYLLTAKNDDEEAKIINESGKRGSVTISAKLAGRGTDIQVDPEAEKLGGLLVIGFERNESRHIDEHIKGRTARQGKKGECIYFLSLSDDLVRIFGGERIQGIMERFGMESMESIEHDLISKAIKNGQIKVAIHNYHRRRQLFHTDSLLDSQRKFIYGFRKKLLYEKDFFEDLKIIVNNISIRAVTNYLRKKDSSKWDKDGFLSYLESFRIFSDNEANAFFDMNKEHNILIKINKHFLNAIEATLSNLGKINFDNFSNLLMIQLIDQIWRDHLAEREMIEHDAFLLPEEPENQYKLYELALNSDYWNRIAKLEDEMLTEIFRWRKNDSTDK
ncbi:MAG: hypothetical protein GY795_36725 [Desulfobacterales bacterium]|nr:hypothetical protein [Desulfobacterales bacterium]